MNSKDTVQTARQDTGDTEDTEALRTEDTGGDSKTTVRTAGTLESEDTVKTARTLWGH